MADLRLRFEKGLAPSLLALPDAVLERMVKRLGERPTTRGTPLDLRASLLLALDRRVHAPLERHSPERARAEAARRVAVTLGRPRDGVETAPVRLEGEGLRAPLEARLHRPRSGRTGPLVVYFHQGGFVFGDPSWTTPFASVLVGTLAARVVSIAYPRAPGTKLPEMVRAARLGALAARARAAEWGADRERWAVAGDSAGGYLASVVAGELAGPDRPRAQLLVYPFLEIEAPRQTPRRPSRVEYAHAHPVSAAFIGWAEAHALPSAESARDSALSPGLRARLDELPPAVVATAGFDPLLDEGDAYAERLAAAGVPVRHRRYLDLPHGFTALAGAVPRAGEAMRELARDLGVLLHGPHGPAAR